MSQLVPTIRQIVLRRLWQGCCWVALALFIALVGAVLKGHHPGRDFSNALLATIALLAATGVLLQVADRRVNPGARTAVLGSIVPQWIAILLFSVTAVLWFVVTDPVSVFVWASTNELDEPMTRADAALFFSVYFGSFSVISGLVGLETLLFGLKPRRERRAAA